MSEAGGYKNIGALVADTSGAIAIGPFGSAMKAETYSSSGVRVIRGTNFGDTGTWKGDWVFVPDVFVDKMPRCEVRAGDLVFPHRGSIGEVAIIPDDGNRYCLSTSLMKATLDPNKADPLFVCYYLKSPAGRQEIMRFGSQVGTPGIGQPLASLRQFNVPNPDVATQRAVVSVLSALDDKIELNRRMNETLEGVAQAIFRDWFIDFGPTRRKAAGEADPVAIMGGLTPDPARAAELAALFPAALGEDGLPVGWDEAEFGAEFDLTMGQSPPGETYNDSGDGLPFFQGRTDFGFRYPENRKFCSAPSRIANAGDTLISVRAPVGDLNMAWERCCIGRGVACARHKSGSASYTFYTLRALQPELELYEHTGTVFGAINRKQFEKLPVVKSSAALLAAFEATAGPMDQKLKLSTQESRTLAETRDYLLPRLMSGAVRVASKAKAA